MDLDRNGEARAENRESQKVHSSIAEEAMHREGVPISHLSRQHVRGRPQPVPILEKIEIGPGFPFRERYEQGKRGEKE
jgi:hypothetical protein